MWEKGAQDLFRSLGFAALGGIQAAEFVALVDWSGLEGLRRIRKIWAGALLVACGIGGSAQRGGPEQDSEPRTFATDLRQIVERSRSDNPSHGLAYDWLDCLERYQSPQDEASTKVLCRSWTTQGVTSSLFALKSGEERIPVVESKLAGAPDGGPFMLDIQGGPGGVPFNTDPVMTDEFIERIRSNGQAKLLGLEMAQTPHFAIMQRGFTIASIGYWGTSVRTFEKPDEIDLAVRDVRMAIDYYREEVGHNPAIITASLGNHLALGALGKARIEATPVLALVPVMDGLQHHLARALEKNAEEAAKAEANGELAGSWTLFNIYTGSGTNNAFDHSRMLSMMEYVPSFIGDADYPWLDVTPRTACSRIILGRDDPRTRSYLARIPAQPDAVEVLEAGHNLVRDRPDETREIFAKFADCVLAEPHGSRSGVQATTTR